MSKYIFNNFKILICCALIFLLAGCFRNHDEDITEIYRDYLEYSLGDFSIVEAKTRTIWFDFKGELLRERYKIWELEYYNYANNRVETIELNNRRGNNLSSIIFNILYRAGRTLMDEVEIKQNKYFSIPHQPSMYFRFLNLNINQLDPIRGVKISELSLMTLTANNYRAEIHTGINLNTNISYSELKERLKEEFIPLFEGKVDNRNLVFVFKVWSVETPMHTGLRIYDLIYCKSGGVYSGDNIYNHELVYCNPGEWTKIDSH